MTFVCNNAAAPASSERKSSEVLNNYTGEWGERIAAASQTAAEIKSLEISYR